MPWVRRFYRCRDTHCHVCLNAAAQDKSTGEGAGIAAGTLVAGASR